MDPKHGSSKLATVVRVTSAGDLLGTGSLIGVPSEGVQGVELKN